MMMMMEMRGFGCGWGVQTFMYETLRNVHTIEMPRFYTTG